MRKLLPIVVLLATLSLYLGREKLFLILPATDDRARESSATGKTFPASPKENSDRDPGLHEDVENRQDSVVVRAGAISRRSSFFLEMQKAGLTAVEIDGVVKASRKKFNLRKVKPGQKFEVFKSLTTGSLDSLNFFIGVDRILKVRKEGERFEASIDTIPYNVTYHLTSGTILYSLFSSLQENGAEPELAGELSQIFGWVIDFFKDIRSGDAYTILYKKREFEDGRSELGPILAARVITQGRAFYAFRYRTKKGGAGYYDLQGKSLQKTLLRAPLKYTRITSNFRMRRYHPLTHSYRPHYGVDYGAPYGTPVHATGDGVVVAATRNRANGRYIKIRHNRSYTTYYLHLSRFAKGIKRGRMVRQGQVIGYVGSTGLATGPHLDYRIKLNGRFVNPRTVKLPSKRPISPEEITLFQRTRDAYLRTFYEATWERAAETTLLVEKPTYPRAKQMEMLF